METPYNCAIWCSATTYQNINSSIISKEAIISFKEMFPPARIFPLAVMHRTGGVQTLSIKQDVLWNKMAFLCLSLRRSFLLFFQGEKSNVGLLTYTLIIECWHLITIVFCWVLKSSSIEMKYKKNHWGYWGLKVMKWGAKS